MNARAASTDRRARNFFADGATYERYSNPMNTNRNARCQLCGARSKTILRLSQVLVPQGSSDIACST